VESALYATPPTFRFAPLRWQLK